MGSFLGGDNGRHADNVVNQTTAEKMQSQRASAAQSPQAAKLMADYGSGKLSLSDALEQAKATGGDAQTMQQMLATDPQAAQRFASDSVKNDGVLGKYFGDGGMQDQVLGAQKGLDANLDQDREDLKGKGESYGLTDNDLKAYGQASGNIARQFGQQEQGLANSLSDRGLSAGDSGSAGAQFSGLQGNKMEQLGQLQQQIAQNRINTAQGLAQFRTQADAQRAARNQQAGLQLGQLGEQSIGTARGQNQAGVNSELGQLNQTAGQERAVNDGQQNQLNNQFQQQEATRSKGLIGQIGDALSGGIAGDVGAIAGAPGKAINSVLGGSSGAGGSGGGSGGSALAKVL